jgi:hypothetical protein
VVTKQIFIDGILKLLQFVHDIQGKYKLSEYFVPVAVCTGTTAVVSVEFS